MNVIGRYMRREILLSVLFVLAGFLALFGFFDFINEVEDVGRGGYRLPHAIINVLLSLPRHAYELMPVVALIGTIYSLAQFVSNSEFTAMRAAGLGRVRAVSQIVRIGLIFALLTLLLGEFVTPWSERIGQQVRLTALGGSVGGQFRSGLWIKDTSAAQAGGETRIRFVNIGALRPDTSLSSVRVYEFDQAFTLKQILQASSGQFNPPNSWTLENVVRTDLEPAMSVEKTLTLKSVRTTLPRLQWRSELNPDLLRVLAVDPDRMSIWNLTEYVRHLRENQQGANRFEIALWRKIVYPIAVIVMMLLALPFGYLQARAGGIGYKVFVGIMIGVAFHFLNGLSAHLGLLNTWPAWLAAGVPSMLAMLIAIAMLVWVDRAR